MRILIACEESQTVCKAFRARGHEAYSADIQDCTGGKPEWHIKGDVLETLDQGWDMMIGHPPCTYISYAGTAHWNNPGRLEKRLKALEFFSRLWLAPIDKICLENPKSCASPTIAKYSQEIQPFYFGEQHYKTTWLWLKGLDQLIHHEEADMFNDRTHVDKPEPISVDASGKNRHWTDTRQGDRQISRSKTFQSIADAMADQWI